MKTVQRRKRRKALIKKLDDLCRQINAIIANRICEHCGKKIEKYGHVAHVIPRTHAYLRWDLINLLYLCFYCHFEWFHKNPMEASEWFQQKFPDRWAYLDGQAKMWDGSMVKRRFFVRKYSDAELLEKTGELQKKLKEVKNGKQ